MIDSGDHEAGADNFAASRAPSRTIELLEWLVDLYGRASDSSACRCTGSTRQGHEAAGNDKSALETYEQLLVRSPEDETTAASI